MDGLPVMNERIDRLMNEWLNGWMNAIDGWRDFNDIIVCGLCSAQTSLQRKWG